MTSPERPIGYWLKHLDGLIEAAFDRALADVQVSRRQWQVMNVLAAGPADDGALSEVLRPFWREGAVSLDEVLGDLAGRGWVRRDEIGRVSLTPEGTEAHRRAAEGVEGLRETMSPGVTEDEYRSVIDVLSRMAANLERSAGG